MSTDHGHDDHGHDAHGGHDDHAAPAAPAAPAPPPAGPPPPPPLNPATREAELVVLQACFHLATRSLFVYFSEPGSLLSLTADDRRLEEIYRKNLAEDGAFADRIANLVRERGTEPQARAFPEKFTRLNYLTYTSAAVYFREDLATHAVALERLHGLLPTDATPTVPALVKDFLDERKKHLAFWSDEEKKAAEALKARLAAKKAAPAKKH
jgi:hypothetical protein